MLNFSHTYLYFKDLTKTYFYGIYVILWDLIDIKKTSFQYLKSLPDCTGGRPAGRPDQESVDHHGRPMCTGRAQRPAYSAGRPRGRPTESTPLLGGGRSTGSSTDGFGPVDQVVDRRLNGQKSDRWPIDRPVDRRGNLGIPRLQQL